MNSTLSFVSFTPRDHYDAVMAEMMRAADGVRAGGPDVAFVGEHHDVITVGRNRGDDDVRGDGTFPVRKTERGGAATAHGPGQVVVYPIFHLRRRGIGVRAFVHALEQLMIDTAQHFGRTLTRRAGAPGVFAGAVKVGAVGIRVSRGVSVHGLALNVSAVPPAFSQITPCGDANTRPEALAHLTPQNATTGAPQPTVEAASVRLKTGLSTYAVVPWSRAAYHRLATNQHRGLN